MKNEAGLRVTGERILVRPPKLEEMTQGGIVIVKKTQEDEERAATTGVLIDASEDAWKVKEMSGIKIGDTIMYAKYAGDAVTLTKSGVLYRVMNARDVVGVVEAELDSKFKAARSTTETFGFADAMSQQS